MNGPNLQLLGRRKAEFYGTRTLPEIEIMLQKVAAELGVEDKEIVKVKIDTARPLIFDDVVVRVSPKFALAMHIDTDECNAAGAFGQVYGEIVK